MKVLVVGIPKVDLLLNLYNNANCQGKAFDDNPSMKVVGRMTANLQGDRAKAEELINKRQDHFDYVDLGAGPRPLKISFVGFEIETQSYDEYNGDGLGVRVVESIRAEIIKQTSTSDDGSLAFLLGAISKRVNQEKKESSEGTANQETASAPKNRLS